MLRILLVCLLLVAAPIAAATPATAATAAADDELPECETTVTHDDFRHDNATIEALENGSETSSVSNTEVTVDTNVAFVRVEAKNPNGYCVKYTVEISPEVVDPADIGYITAVDGDETATWRSIHDFDAEERYTKVEFVLEGGESATFAPSQVQVQTLKWAGKAEEKSSGVLSKLSDVGSSLPIIGGDEDLEKREYRFSAENESDRVPVSLANESTEQQVDEYHALYRTDDRGWTPVGTDSDAPVFIREHEDEQLVEFQFNDPDAEVKFVANPTRGEKLSYEWQKYWSGFDSISDVFPGFSSSVLVPFAVASRRRTEVTENP